jgi:hypothetical protein
MKVLIPGGTGQVGKLLASAFVADGHEVVVLSRKPGQAPWRVVRWDAETPGAGAAQAAPRPTAKVDDLIASSSHARNAQMHNTDRPLTHDEQQEIGSYVTFALRGLGAQADKEPPEELQNQLRMAIDEFRLWDEERRAANLDKASLCMGCLWGQTLCDGCGWEWASVSLGSEWENYGVVSPNRSHVVFPLQFARELLRDPERDQTSLLLHNMVKAANLPPADPGSYQVIG